MYTLPQALVQANGQISSYFSLARETRQGSPSSPLLFCLALEPLAIRAITNFPGVSVGRRVHKLILYADDIVVCLRASKVSSMFVGDY